MATRTRAPRRRHDTEPPARVAAKGLIVAALAAVLGWIAISAYSGVPGRSYRTVYADVPQIGNLIQHDQVRIAGVRVGQVLGTSVARGGGARLRLQLEPGTTLTSDTQISVRANGLLGARYVQLVPGHSDRVLADGATIKGTSRSLTFGVPETLDTFDAATRGALGDLLGGLGNGLLGQGPALNQTIAINARVQPGFLKLIDEILARPGAAQRLLPSLDSAVSAIDSAGQDVPNGIRAGAAALQPFAAKQPAIRGALDAAPPALDAADHGLNNGRRLLTAARALATSASLTLPSAPRGLRQASALLRESHTPLARANTLLQAVPPAVPAALKLTAALRPVLDPLHQGLGDVLPMLNKIAPYGCNIENLGAVFRSMTGFGGTGEGPGGPAMEFRLQAVPSQETLGLDTGKASLVKRDGYPAPCKYMATTYPLALTKGTR
jgi:virulence factor Mce-like protein